MPDATTPAPRRVEIRRTISARSLFSPEVLHPAGLTAGDWVTIEGRDDFAGLVGLLVGKVEDVPRPGIGWWTRLVVHIVGADGTTKAEWRGDVAHVRRAYIREIPASRLIGVTRARLEALGYTD